MKMCVLEWERMDGWSWKRKRSWVLAMAAFFTQDRWLGGECLLRSVGLRLEWLCSRRERLSQGL